MYKVRTGEEAFQVDADRFSIRSSVTDVPQYIEFMKNDEIVFIAPFDVLNSVIKV